MSKQQGPNSPAPVQVPWILVYPRKVPVSLPYGTHANIRWRASHRERCLGLLQVFIRADSSPGLSPANDLLLACSQFFIPYFLI